MHKTLTGLVVSVKNKETIVVEVFRKRPHPMYRKLLKRSKRYRVAANGHEVALGESVVIEEIKPMSKGKFFQLKSVKVIGSPKKGKENVTA